VRATHLHLPLLTPQDSDERAVAYIGGPAPARWGPLGYHGPLEALEGPLTPPMKSAVRRGPGCVACCAACCVQRAVCSVLCAACCVQRAVCSVLCAAGCVQRAVCSGLCAAGCVQRAVCGVLAFACPCGTESRAQAHASCFSALQHHAALSSGDRP
jgi:hypothetical protein